jgi:hypothetical protein
MSVREPPPREASPQRPAEIACECFAKAERCMLEAQEHRKQGRSLLAVHKFADARYLRRVGRYWRERCVVISQSAEALCA